MSTVLISHRDCVGHEISAGHPECPQRIDVINDQLMKQEIYDYLQHRDAPRATREQLMLAHSEAYVDLIHQKAPSSGTVQLDPDTAMNVHSLDASLRAAGAGVLAVDMVCGGDAKNAFCLTRPPGHHAERIQAMGFCFFGNIAIAARHAVKEHGLERVAYWILMFTMATAPKTSLMAIPLSCSALHFSTLFIRVTTVRMCLISALMYR